jgi:hypothetical protein
MEPDGSSPHSQELSTCPYPESDQSSEYLTDIKKNDSTNLTGHITSGKAKLEVMRFAIPFEAHSIGQIKASVRTVRRFQRSQIKTPKLHSMCPAPWQLEDTREISMQVPYTH